MSGCGVLYYCITHVPLQLLFHYFFLITRLLSHVLLAAIFLPFSHLGTDLTELSSFDQNFVTVL